MNSRSLARLAALTQGVALVGAGIFACGNSADSAVPPATAFTLTPMTAVDGGSTPDIAPDDAARATTTPSVDAVPTNIVDAGPAPATDLADATDAGHRRHRPYPIPNAPPRHRFDAGF